ncbi:circadian clock protein KaiB [Hymenobacter sp. RP-2-7]|uniref:Circadian clock protein KaiB n=1 Tax=Hymenobacter polaris TaxID=2682546 RepID=A0A7Y0FKL5_9BACT|nr:circadian clock KaiB family protein [Hymenobacter polaris]NML63838.1 circadian clock protein KaiB [Hymenobacter polaris]
MIASPRPPNSDEAPEFIFQLFITGATPNSARAVRNCKEICEHYLAGRYVLHIVDIYQQPELVREHQILAVPMLLRMEPLPHRRIIGDLSAREKVLEALGLPLLP